MVYTTQYASPGGGITRACDEAAIVGLWFDGQKYFGNILPEQRAEKNIRCCGIMSGLFVPKKGTAR